MHGRTTSKLTYANVVATLALFIALGGGAYAATQLENNSVGTNQIRDGAVTGEKVKDHSLTGNDVRASSLGTVPNAARLGGSPAASYVTKAQNATTEDWHLIGTAGNPDFATCGSSDPCWANAPNIFAGVFNKAGFYRDPEGIVHLKGLIKNVSGAEQSDQDFFTLPAGYGVGATTGGDGKDWNWRDFPAAASGNKPGQVEVIFGSHVRAMSLVAPNGTISLDGISFRCAPSGQDGCP